MVKVNSSAFSANSSTIVAKPFYSKVAELLIDSRGISYSWATIKSTIESYATNVEANDLADTKANFRFLGPGDAGSLEKLSDETYFSGVTSTRSVNPDLKDEYNKVTVIAIRDPRVTISTAACDKVGRFLNYTPSIVASQMIPYLESPGDARCIEKQVARPVFKITIFMVIFNLLSRRPVA